MTKSPDTYRVDDQELLLGFYKKLLWDRITPRIPASVTPNALTVIGQSLAVLSAVACAGAVPWGGSPGYPILFVVSSFCMLGYLTLDNIDGAHARRTGQCSPLGEFLDHGLDGLGSGSILIVTGLVLSLDGTMMALVCTLGALGFASMFWEQFRTGILVIPKVSSTEGITLLVIYQLLVTIFGQPDWLRFSLDHITAGTIIIGLVVIAYAFATVPPFVRAAKAGFIPYDMAPFFVLAGIQVAFAPLGANGLIPAITNGLMAASLTCRMIIFRHRTEPGTLVPIAMYLAAVPFALAIVLPDVWTYSGWAAISAAIVAIDYARILWSGSQLLMAHAREAVS